MHTIQSHRFNRRSRMRKAIRLLAPLALVGLALACNLEKRKQERYSDVLEAGLPSGCVSFVTSLRELHVDCVGYRGDDISEARDKVKRKVQTDCAKIQSLGFRSVIVDLGPGAKPAVLKAENIQDAECEPKAL